VKNGFTITIDRTKMKIDPIIAVSDVESSSNGTSPFLDAEVGMEERSLMFWSLTMKKCYFACTNGAHTNIPP
jgi:hypothetical protein